MDNGRENVVVCTLVAILFWWKLRSERNVIQFSIPAAFVCRDKFGGHSVIIQSEGLAFWLVDYSLPVKCSKDWLKWARGHFNPLVPRGYPMFHTVWTHTNSAFCPSSQFMYLVLCGVISGILHPGCSHRHGIYRYQILEITSALKFVPLML